MRLVLDTNVLVSGLIRADGPPGQLLRAVRQERVVLVTSPPLIAELERVLVRSKLQRYFESGAAHTLVRLIDAVADIVPEPLPNVDISPDPDDNVVLATALAGKADALVTGDKKDLLTLADRAAIRIWSARDASKRLLPK